MTAPYRPGQTVTLSANPADYGATGATSLTFVVKDAAGDEVQASQPALLVDGVYSLVVGLIANATDQLIDTRIVELAFEMPSGEPVLTSLTYDIVSLRQLRVPEESPQTYEQAELYARINMPSLEGWAAAGKEQRIQALLESSRALRNLPWKRCGATMTPEHIEKCQICSNPFLMSRQQLRAHPMWTHLCAAQLKQCNYLLGGKPLDDLRSAGLMSNTVGESSQMYRMQVPLDLGVGKDALKQVGRWISYSVQLKRT